MYIDSELREDDRGRNVCQIKRSDVIMAKRDNFGQILMVDLHSVSNLFRICDERISTTTPLIPSNTFVYIFCNGDTILHRAIERTRMYYYLLQRSNVEVDWTQNIRADAHLIAMVQRLGEFEGELDVSIPVTILSTEEVFVEVVSRLNEFRDVELIRALPPTKMANKSLSDRSWADPLKKRLYENAHLPIIKYR